MSTEAAAPAEGATDLLEHMAGENAGNAAPQATPAPTAGNPSRDAAPAPGQPASGAEGKEGKAAGPADPNAQAAKPTIEQVAAERLGLKGTGENAVEFYQTKYAESSREAKSLAQFKTQISSALEKVGISIAPNSEGEIGFIANNDYVADVMKTISAEVSESLSKADKDKFLDDPDAVITAITEKALKLAVAKPVPNMRSEDVQISDLDAKFVRDRLVASKRPDGTEVLPEYEQLERWIDQKMADPSTPEAFRSFAQSSTENYEFALSLMYAQTANALLPYLDNGSNGRKSKAANDISLTSEQPAAGGDAPSGDGAQDAEKAAQDEIVNAPRSHFGSG